MTLILTPYQANVPTLMPFSKEDNILIKSLYKCRSYNAWQLEQSFCLKVG